ncbi:hypothetical protein BH11MYX1_BH11MYX1_38200 [soil metagenome]
MAFSACATARVARGSWSVDRVALSVTARSRTRRLASDVRVDDRCCSIEAHAARGANRCEQRPHFSNHARPVRRPGRIEQGPGGVVSPEGEVSARHGISLRGIARALCSELLKRRDVRRRGETFRERGNCRSITTRIREHLDVSGDEWLGFAKRALPSRSRRRADDALLVGEQQQARERSDLTVGGGQLPASATVDPMPILDRVLPR